MPLRRLIDWVAGGAALTQTRNWVAINLGHKVFQLVFGATMTLLIAMEFKHSIVKGSTYHDQSLSCRPAAWPHVSSKRRRLIQLLQHRRR